MIRQFSDAIKGIDEDANHRFFRLAVSDLMTYFKYFGKIFFMSNKGLETSTYAM